MSGIFSYLGKALWLIMFFTVKRIIVSVFSSQEIFQDMIREKTCCWKKGLLLLVAPFLLCLRIERHF